MLCKQDATTSNNDGIALHSGKNTTLKTCCLQGGHVLCTCVAPAMLEELCKRIQHCCATLRRSRNKRNVGKFDWFQTLRNNSQQHATTCNRVCKQTQHLTSNNVGSCGPPMLRPFGGGLTRPSRSMHFCDVSQTNGPRSPKRMGRAGVSVAEQLER